MDTGALTDEDHARLTRALGSGYLLPTSERRGCAAGAASSGGAPMADQAAGMMPAVGSALGALPQAAQGAATAPAQGAGGLAGAATPLAGLASGLLDRSGEPGLPEDRVDHEPRPDEEHRRRRNRHRGRRHEAEEDSTDDRPPSRSRPATANRRRAVPRRPGPPACCRSPMASIRITPALLNQVAARHESVADEIAVARSAGSDILASVATHGPIMHQFKAAANEVVQRRECGLRRPRGRSPRRGRQVAFHRAAIRRARRDQRRGGPL